jgi:MSHA biogenesis protein MshQ
MTLARACRSLVICGLSYLAATVFASTVWAVTCTTNNANGNWNAPGTWSGCTGGNGTPANTPGSNDDVVIANVGRTFTVTANAAAQSVTFTAGNQNTTLTLNAGTQLTVGAGGVTINATTNNRTKQIVLTAGTTVLTVNGDVTLASSGGAGALAQISLGNNAGTLVTITGDLTTDGTGEQIVFAGLGTMQIGGNYTSGGVLTRGTGTVTYNGAGAQSVGAYTYNNLTINKASNTATLSGNSPVAADLTISSGTLDLDTFAADRTAAGGGTVTISNGASLLIGGTGTFPANYATRTLGATSTVNYDGAAQAVLAVPNPGYGHLIVSGTSTKTPGGSFTVRGDLSISGVTLASVTTVQTVNGNVSNTGTHTATTGNITLSGGAAAHTLSGTGSYANLVLNDAQGATLSADTTVATVLTLTAGVITTGVNSLIASANCPASVSRTNGWVAGFLRLRFPTIAATCTFHVGDASNYRPIANMSFSGVTVAGDVTGSVSLAAGEHPSIDSSSIDSARDVNRYWTLTNGGVTFTTFIATLTFVPAVLGEVDATADTTTFIAQSFAGGVWTDLGVGSRTSSTTRITGVSTFGDFAIGNQVVPAAGVGSFNAFETTTAGTSVTGVIKTKVAGTSFTVDVVALNFARTAKNPSFTGTVRVELLNASDNTGTLDSDGCRNTWVVIQTLSPDTTFVIGDAGRKSVSFTEPNSWPEMRVRMRNFPTGTLIGCSTDAFAVRPSGFTVSATDGDWQSAGTTRSLANSASTGGNVHKSGQPFTLRAVATPASATNYAGTPVKKTTSCILPASGCVFSDAMIGLGSWTGAGTRTSSTATYAEVGAFSVELEDQSFANIDAADSSTLERYIPQSGGALTVGRFVPDHFAVATNNTPRFRTFGVTDTSCSASASAPKRTFTYIGQSFGFETSPRALVTAENAANVTTQNYSQTLWKITSANVTQTYSTAQARDADVVNAPTVTKLDNGTGTVTANADVAVSPDKLTFTRSTTSAAVPFNANISLTLSVVDSAEASVSGNGTISSSTSALFNGGGAGIAFDGGGSKEFRYGRLSLRNANGSQLLPLGLRMETQYWLEPAPGKGFFATNVADNCTAVATANVGLGNYAGGLASGDTTAAITGVPFTGGVHTLTLSAPGASKRGSVTVIVNLGTTTTVASCLTFTPSAPTPAGASLGHLRGVWCGAPANPGGTYTKDPTATARFGVYGGAEDVIDMREVF